MILPKVCVIFVHTKEVNLPFISGEKLGNNIFNYNILFAGNR